MIYNTDPQLWDNDATKRRYPRLTLRCGGVYEPGKPGPPVAQFPNDASAVSTLIAAGWIVDGENITTPASHYDDL